MIRLIVNADDLGSGTLRDRGIFAAFHHGIVTSTSLLANGPSFAAAAREALACGLPLGVHLNLSEGTSLTGAIAGLTDTTGTFPGKMPLRAILQAGTFDRTGVRRELLAQVDRVRQSGLAPDHLDTHQHCLLFPALTAIVIEVAETSGIRALRLPFPTEAGGGTLREKGGAAASSDDRADACATGIAACRSDNPERSGAGRGRLTAAVLRDEGVQYPSAGGRPAVPLLASELALYRQLAPAARANLQVAQLWTPDGLWGMPLLNRLDEATLAATLQEIPAGTWELMTHPGHPDPADSFAGPEREAELQALTAPAIRRLVAERGIVLTTFGECACVC